MKRPPCSFGRSAAVLTALLGLFGPRPGLATTVGQVIEITAPGGQRSPAISWEPNAALPGGGIYMLVWEDDRNAGGTPDTGVDLYASRIEPDGTQVDMNGVNLLEAAARPGNQTLPSIVFAPTVAPPVHLITWTDPRNAIPDVYGARLESSTMSVIPSAGFQITTTTADTEAFSDVSYGNSRYLVVYQRNGRSGITVEAQRMFTDTTMDGPPIEVGPSQSLNPSVVHSGSNFVFGFETGAGRAIGGTLDATSGTMATTATIATSTVSQALVRMSPLGTDVLAVWQDGRNPSRDIYGVVLDPSTMVPRGSEFAISDAREVQQNPDVDGDSSGALVVWQDRRNTASNAQIFATRMDPVTGAVRDDEGFPVFTFRGNAFEPAVVKGPGRDYLVAAIRFGTPPRLYYRLVRDEDPAGTMTGAGRLVVDGDGVATATVGFARAQGASGLSVVDGTLYDVTLSSSSPVIVEADADPTRMGHQVQSLGGVVSVSLRSTAVEQVTVTLSSVEGSSSGTATVEFLNVAPVVSDVVITPPQPRSVEDLQLTYTYFDVNGDAESGTEIVWLKDNGTQPMFDDQVSVPASATSRGQNWRAWVRPSDGSLMNEARTFSSTVTIGNTPPSVADFSVVRDVDPNQPLRTGERVVLRYRFVDADNDREGPTRIEWFDDGTPMPAFDDLKAIPAADVVKGQIWSARITPHDGFEAGASVTTNAITAVNTGPISNAGPNVDVIERRSVTLDGTMSSDVDPQDQLLYTWTVVSAPEGAALDDPSSATPVFSAPSVPHDSLAMLDLVVSDGEAMSGTDRVAIEIKAVADGDQDGLDDEEEAEAGTNPNARDSDKDQLDDGDEIANGLDPLDQDSDDDGLRDGQEGQACPNDCEADPYGDANGNQVINALDPDADGDGLPDGLELSVQRPLEARTIDGFDVLGTDEAAGAFIADSDVSTFTDPTSADTDEDSFEDGVEDANKNGRVDDGESDPNDRLDPGTPCTGEGDCAGDLICVEGTCQMPGNDCEPLPDTVECCVGSCVASAEVAEAICAAGAMLESCPVGARQCAANSCSAPDVQPQPKDGCTCATPSKGPQPWAFGLLLLGWVAFRRRR